MARLGVVFPGQGSQYLGMGRELYGHFDEARACFDEAGRILGSDLSRLCFEGPRESLDLTVNTQTATLTLEAAAWAVLEKSISVSPLAMAGHSLGEYGALCASGVIPFADALRVVQARAARQQEAVAPGIGANAAIQGLSRDRVEALCAEVAAASGVVSPSCYNAQDQTVVSGMAEPVERVMAKALAEGAKRALKLPLSVPFHSPLLKEAAARFGTDIAGQRFAKGRFPVIPNCDPDVRHSEATTRDLLIRQIVEPVRWVETIEQMVRMGVDTIIEVGPKRVLSVLAVRIHKGLKLFNVENLESLEMTVIALKAGG